MSSIRAGKTEKHVGRLLLLFPLFYELTGHLTRMVDIHKMFIAKSLKLLHQMRWNFAENLFESYILILCKLELDSRNFVTQLLDPKLGSSISRRKKFKNSLSRLQKIWMRSKCYTLFMLVRPPFFEILTIFTTTMDFHARNICVIVIYHFKSEKHLLF